MDELLYSYHSLFVEVLNRNVNVTWLILAILLLRLLLRKAPKWSTCLLWVLVAVQLICPLRISSPLSVYNLASTAAQSGMTEYFHYNESTEKPELQADFPVADSPETADITVTDSADVHTADYYLPDLELIWLAGVIGFAIYGLHGYLSLRKKVNVSINLKDNLWLCDAVDSPFILGVLRPRIYLPSDLEEEQLFYVTAHENAHLKRRDHWWKPLGFVLLMINWFNPLIWTAYLLLCRDIELACDERVCRNMEAAGRRAYAETLLVLSMPNQSKAMAVCPLAFGQASVRKRVKTIVKYKKPAFWIVLAAVFACIALGVCFLTTPEITLLSANNPIIEVAYYDNRTENAAPHQGYFSDAQIDELTSARLKDLKKYKKSDLYLDQTPLYQLSVHLQDGSRMLINGYSAVDTMVDIVCGDQRYVVYDDEFCEYLSNVCAGNDVAAADEAPIR